jgi:SAM-dependent methyltransferase
MCRGIDISSEMAKQYNLVAKEASYSSEKMHAIQGDLLDVTATPSPELETDAYKKFDFAVMSLALHHVNDVEGMIRRLAERLDEGGVLVIADWVAESNGGHHKHQNHGHGVHAPHHGGFTEADLRKIFEKAGLGNWGWKLFEKPLEVPSAPGRQKQGFLARGTKGA